MTEDAGSVNAVCVENGRFAAVGNYTDFDPALTDDAEMVNLEGASVFPGFIDTHSCTGLDAFDAKVVKKMNWTDDDITDWIHDAVKYMRSKGAAIITMHGPEDKPGSLFRRFSDNSSGSFFYNVDYQSEFEKDLGDTDYYEGILSDPLTSFLLFNPVYDDCDGVRDTLQELTIRGARKLGIDDRYGTIEVGKCADLTVLPHNPYLQNMRSFSRSFSTLVLHDGEPVYSEHDEALDELYNMMLTQYL